MAKIHLVNFEYSARLNRFSSIRDIKFVSLFVNSIYI